MCLIQGGRSVPCNGLPGPAAQCQTQGERKVPDVAVHLLEQKKSWLENSFVLIIWEEHPNHCLTMSLQSGDKQCLPCFNDGSSHSSRLATSLSLIGGGSGTALCSQFLVVTLEGGRAFASYFNC